MNSKEIDVWIEEIQPKQSLLTQSLKTIIENLLHSRDIEYLSVNGRTKTVTGIKDKIKKKRYKDPKKQLTDISGIRIILYTESSVLQTADLIRSIFNVDDANSLDKDTLLAANQMGYRSIHLVCDIGKDRNKLAEYEDFKGLKFEIQIRTLLQHAWAEFSHDREYKFSGTLPRGLERKLFLYAGMLEVADKGFDELSKEIDSYVKKIKAQTKSGDLDLEINSITVRDFVDSWVKSHGLAYTHTDTSDDTNELVNEMKQFGISSLKELSAIIPKDYAKHLKGFKGTISRMGLVREWMLIKDYKRFVRDVDFKWSLIPGDQDDEILQSYLGDKFNELVELVDAKENE